MLKRIIISLAALLAALAIVTPAHALAPVISNVVKTDLGAGSYRFTANINQAEFITGYPQKGGVNPSVSGGCKGVYKRKNNGQQLFQFVTCATPGTVSFTTPYAPACESEFVLTATTGSDSSSYVNQIGQFCPPPAPAAIVVTYGDGVALFDNTAATVDQQSVFSVGLVGASDATLCNVVSTDATFSAHITKHFAGPNGVKYVYYTLDGNGYVHVSAGSVSYVIWNCV